MLKTSIFTSTRLNDVVYRSFPTSAERGTPAASSSSWAPTSAGIASLRPSPMKSLLVSEEERQDRDREESKRGERERRARDTRGETREEMHEREREKRNEKR
eukprot:381436-Amorphochlora_amoeboformis.AAC.1